MAGIDGGSMTHRARMLAAIRGEPTDLIPWAPRMDLWAIGQRATGTAPAHLAGLAPVEIAEALGVGCRVVQADFTRPGDADDLHLRAFGVERHEDFPFRVELRDLPLHVEEADGFFHTVIETAAGPVITRFELTPAMIRQGSYDPRVAQFAIRTPDDIEGVAQVFEHLEVVPQPNGFRSFRDRVGERGLAVASGAIAASPMHLVMHDLVDLEPFIYLYHDAPEALRELASRMSPFFEQLLSTVLACNPEIMFWGGNYDQSLTWPSFFRDEITPWLQHVSERAHTQGTLLLTHADGESEALLPMFPGCGIDVAESVCTRPMVRQTLAQLRAGFGPATTVWGGIPAVALLPEVMGDDTFEQFLDDTFAELGTGERLIFGVSDNVPPEADLDRLQRVADRILGFGPVVPQGTPACADPPEAAAAAASAP